MSRSERGAPAWMSTLPSFSASLIWEVESFLLPWKSSVLDDGALLDRHDEGHAFGRPLGLDPGVLEESRLPEGRKILAELLRVVGVADLHAEVMRDRVRRHGLIPDDADADDRVGAHRGGSGCRRGGFRRRHRRHGGHRGRGSAPESAPRTAANPERPRGRGPRKKPISAAASGLAAPKDPLRKKLSPLGDRLALARRDSQPIRSRPEPRSLRAARRGRRSATPKRGPRRFSGSRAAGAALPCSGRPRSGRAATRSLRRRCRSRLPSGRGSC